jgi:hypothetical protein
MKRQSSSTSIEDLESEKYCEFADLKPW